MRKFNLALKGVYAEPQVRKERGRLQFHMVPPASIASLPLLTMIAY